MESLSQAAIGRELGLSRAAVTKLKARGMPVSSADAARQWRSVNLNPAMVKADPGPSVRTLVDRVNALGLTASSAIEAGRFDLVENAVRAALTAVPPSQRGQVLLPIDVFDALTGHVAAVLAEQSGGAGQELSDEQADDMGNFWSAVAAGEVTVLVPRLR